MTNDELMKRTKKAKHKLNIMPDMTKDEFNILESDILMYGYNPRFPITLYEGAILDGWQRYKACQKHGVVPVYENFEGTTLEAFMFMVRANMVRKSITPAEWSRVANSACDLKIKIERGENDDL